jgi:hypothetical protein
MDFLNAAPILAKTLYAQLLRLSVASSRENDAMKMLLLLSGIIVETSLVFDNPDQAAQASLEKLGALLQTRPNGGKLGYKALPPSTMIDQEIEKGRALGRQLFEDWMDCTFEFQHHFLKITHDIMLTWEQEGHRRADMLRLMSECVYRGLAYEISAQELCDFVVERKASTIQWSLNDSIAALSAVAGHKLTQSSNACQIFGQTEFIEDLDQLVCIMTQEAVRLGVPAGSDWRFGLAANDVPVTAPYELIDILSPICDSFFASINMDSAEDQAVACAKAAGRMLAVTSGGEMPEIEPAIAKPLALAAITDTYKSVCMTRRQAAE